MFLIIAKKKKKGSYRPAWANKGESEPNSKQGGGEEEKGLSGKKTKFTLGHWGEGKEDELGSFRSSMNKSALDAN